MVLLKRLKIETRAAHEQIEHDLQLTKRTGSRLAYRALLQRFYGFHAAWEAQAGVLIADPAFFDRRRKTHLLVGDLRALGLGTDAITALPLCRPLMPMPTRAAALGAMYVVEGSTLGGTVIAHHVKHALGLTPETGCAYFSGYGAEVGRMWRAFGERLTEMSSPDTDDEIVASAARTFDRMRIWLCPPEVEEAVAA